MLKQIKQKNQGDMYKNTNSKEFKSIKLNLRIHINFLKEFKKVKILITSH